jgi:predicted nucleic acid-binding protein
MTEKYLLDTQIWIDHYLERIPHGEAALKLILKIIAEDSIIIFSNFIEKEMTDIGLSKTEIESLLSMIKPNHIKKVSVTKSQFEEAHRIAKQKNIPLGDSIHAIIARDNEAQLVSRDEKDFRKIKDIAIMKEPKDLL